MVKTETQISFRVTNEFKERLERERRSVANMVRNVVEDYLKEKESE